MTWQNDRLYKGCRYFEKEVVFVSFDRAPASPKGTWSRRIGTVHSLLKNISMKKKPAQKLLWTHGWCSGKWLGCGGFSHLLPQQWGEEGLGESVYTVQYSFPPIKCFQINQKGWERILTQETKERQKTQGKKRFIDSWHSSEKQMGK